MLRRPHGPSRARVLDRALELLEQHAQLGDATGAELLIEAGIELGDKLSDDGEDREPPGPRRDELGATVRRIRDPLDVSGPLEMRDEFGHRLLRDPCAVGQHTDARPGVVDVARRVAGPGGIVHIPGGQEHTIRNESAATAEAYVVYADGAATMEAFVRAAAALVADGDPSPDAVMALAARHGIEMTRPIPAG